MTTLTTVKSNTISSLVAREPLVRARAGDVGQPLRPAHRLLQLPALGRGRRVHPHGRVEDGEGVSQLVVQELI